jgi:hypothetical protein
VTAKTIEKIDATDVHGELMLLNVKLKFSFAFYRNRLTVSSISIHQHKRRSCNLENVDLIIRMSKKLELSICRHCMGKRCRYNHGGHVEGVAISNTAAFAALRCRTADRPATLLCEIGAPTDQR